jgi:hypothetical protein
MRAMQREAEAELGDVTARLDTETLGKSQKVAPNLLKAMQGSGNADLLATSDGKTQQLDALLAKASQYSAFIRTSQEAASGAFNQHAIDQMQQAEDDDEGDGAAGEKRKKGGKVPHARFRNEAAHSRTWALRLKTQLFAPLPPPIFAPLHRTGLGQEEEEQGGGHRRGGGGVR